MDDEESACGSSPQPCRCMADMAFSRARRAGGGSGCRWAYGHRRWRSWSCCDSGSEWNAGKSDGARAGRAPVRPLRSGGPGVAGLPGEHAWLAGGIPLCDEKIVALVRMIDATCNGRSLTTKRVEKPLGQLSRPASAGRETGSTASRSLRAVHRWQRRCAKRPDYVPPRKRPGDREEPGGVCELRSGQGARLAGKVNGSEWLINVVTRDKRK